YCRQIIGAYDVEQVSIEGLMIEDCTYSWVEFPSGLTFYSGTAVICNNSTISFRDTIVTSSYSGISCSDCDLEIVGTEITKNSQVGLSVRGDSCLTISHTIATGNSIGIDCFSGCDAQILNCLIAGNRECGISFGQTSAAILGTTIAGNSRHSSTGCGVQSNSNSETFLSDCIIWDNPRTFNRTHGSITVQHSDLDGAFEGEGNIASDPMFTRGPLGEYYLHPDCPCIDAGSQSAEEAGLSDRTTQTDGTPDSGMVDMGYHYPIAEADVGVSCSLNADEFAPGDVIRASMGLENRGSDIAVDIYAVIVLPDGSVISLIEGAFGVGLWPWHSDLLLPSGFAAGPQIIFELAIPLSTESGDYSFIAAVCWPGMEYSGLLSSDESRFSIAPLE
ncbi:MAG: right-handed parallel beta-helix repeat-containing protein, partial [Candidatus Coatesbacteria bacterium]|nr:right-handed parallel beta-helix repeat-containing protein [Candidatus Coatesbacteria bacterium]